MLWTAQWGGLIRILAISHNAYRKEYESYLSGAEGLDASSEGSSGISQLRQLGEKMNTTLLKKWLSICDTAL